MGFVRNWTLAFGLAFAAIAPAMAGETLVVASYGGRTPEFWRTYVFNEFTKDTGIIVEQNIVADRIVAGITAQQQSGNVQWDMAFGLAPSDFEQLKRDKALAPLPKELMAALSANNPLVQDYGIPDQSQANIIACNTLSVDKCPKTASEFFDIKSFPGRRFMPSFQPLEAFSMAAYAAGERADALYPLDVDKAIGMLEKVRPSIVQFYNNSTIVRQLLASGEAQIGIMWSNTPPQIETEGNVKVKLNVSWDGAAIFNLWTVVFKNAPNESNAWKFVRWLNDNPKHLANFLNANASASANRATFPFLSQTVTRWSPEASRPEPHIRVDYNWFGNAGAVKTRIDEFWANYIN